MRIGHSPDGPTHRWERCAEHNQESTLAAATAATTHRSCPGCDLPTECLEHALAHDDRFGIQRTGANQARRIS